VNSTSARTFRARTHAARDAAERLVTEAMRRGSSYGEGEGCTRNEEGKKRVTLQSACRRIRRDMERAATKRSRCRGASFDRPTFAPSGLRNGGSIAGCAAVIATLRNCDTREQGAARALVPVAVGVGRERRESSSGGPTTTAKGPEGESLVALELEVEGVGRLAGPRRLRVSGSGRWPNRVNPRGAGLLSGCRPL